MESHQKMKLDIQNPIAESIKVDCSIFSLNPLNQDIKLEVQEDEVKKELLDCDMSLEHLDQLQVPKVEPIDFDFNVIDFAFDNGPIKLEPQNILDPIQIKEETDEIVIQTGNEPIPGNNQLIEEFSANQSLIPNNLQPGIYDIPTHQMQQGEELPEGAIVFQPATPNSGLPVIQNVQVLEPVLPNVQNTKRALKLPSSLPNMLPDIFEVTCKGLKALFHKSLFHSGAHGKCIQFGNQMLRPNEFEHRAGSRAKKYKASIYYQGYPIKNLFEAGLLIDRKSNLKFNQNQHEKKYQGKIVGSRSFVSNIDPLCPPPFPNYTPIAPRPQVQKTSKDDSKVSQIVVSKVVTITAGENNLFCQNCLKTVSQHEQSEHVNQGCDLILLKSLVTN